MTALSLDADAERVIANARQALQVEPAAVTLRTAAGNLLGIAYQLESGSQARSRQHLAQGLRGAAGVMDLYRAALETQAALGMLGMPYQVAGAVAMLHGVAQLAVARAEILLGEWRIARERWRDPFGCDHCGQKRRVVVTVQPHPSVTSPAEPYRVCEQCRALISKQGWEVRA